MGRRAERQTRSSMTSKGAGTVARLDGAERETGDGRLTDIRLEQPSGDLEEAGPVVADHRQARRAGQGRAPDLVVGGPGVVPGARGDGHDLDVLRRDVLPGGMRPWPPDIEELGHTDGPEVPAPGRLAAAAGVLLEAREGRHLGGDAPFVIVAAAEPQHPALGVAEGGEEVALRLAELALLGQPDEDLEVPAHEGLLGEDVAEVVAEAHGTEDARARARPREEPLGVESSVKEDPPAHLVGTLQVGARERLRDEQALEVRALEGIPVGSTPAPLHLTRSVVRGDDRHLVGQSQPGRPRVAWPEAHAPLGAGGVIVQMCVL